MASANTSQRILRKDCEILLLGTYSSQIIGRKLPSKRQVLKVLFFNLRVVKSTLQESAGLAIRETLVFWEKARIPTQSEKNCIPKLKLLYEEWRNIQKFSFKPAEKKSVKQKETESKFVSELDDLFDIGSQNVLSIMKNKEDIEFLKKQREKGRPGYMHGIDYELTRQEKSEITEVNERWNQELEESAEEIPLSDTSESESTFSMNDNEPIKQLNSKIRNKAVPQIRRGRQQVINERVISALDKCKISDREAMHLISAVADALGHNLNTLVLNRTSLQRSRRAIRKAKAEKIKNMFNNIELNAAVVHWDGKLLPGLMGRETVDRLPIIITNGDIEQILHVPALENGTGKMQAEAVFHALCDWGLDSTIEACCFDTTAVNTGALNGACVLLEGLLERQLLYLPCRHHISEILLKAAFECKFPKSSGPNVPLFKRFQDAWPKLDKRKFLPGIEEKQINDIFSVDKYTIVEFLRSLHNFTRNDYEEFSTLCLIFLGESTKKNISFKYPGAMHHARWMSKAIYTLKIYLFRTEFKMNASTTSALRDLCIFIVKIYVQYWFLSHQSTKAPYTDFKLIKDLHEFRNVDEVLSDTVLCKLLNHLWYLSPEPMAFSLFDDEIDFEIKEKMRTNINNVVDPEEEMRPPKRVMFTRLEVEEVISKELHQFTCPATKLFFNRFGINSSFLNESAFEWGYNKAYKEGQKIAEKIKVVNDTAERAVRLIEEYNCKLSTDEDQKQFIIQVVSHYRKKYPNCQKLTLSMGLQENLN